jgi:hypothetical protein
MSQKNSFAILNSIEDKILVDTAIKLDINLADDAEGRIEQITPIKAE